MGYDFNKIINCLKENDVKINRYYENALDNEPTSSVDAYNLGKTIKDDIEKLTIYGVNNGFDKKTKNSIEVLSNIYISLIDENLSAKKFEKMNNEASLCVEGYKFKSTYELKDNIIDYLSRTKTALELVPDDISDREKQSIENALSQIDEITGKVSNVIDFSSEKAYQTSVEFIRSITNVRSKLRKGSYNATINELLSNASRDLDRWVNSTIGVSKNNKLADKDLLDKFVSDLLRKDKLDNKVNFEANRDEFVSFCEFFNRKKNEVENSETIIKLSKESEEQRNILKKIDSDRKELIAKFANKQASQADILSFEKRVKITESAAKARIASIDRQLNNQDALRSNRIKLFTIIEEIMSNVRMYDNTDQIKEFNIITKNVNYDELREVLTSASDAQLAKKVADQLARVQISVKNMVKLVYETDTELNNSLESILELQDELDIVDINVSENKETVTISDEDFLAQYAKEHNISIDELQNDNNTDEQEVNVERLVESAPSEDEA